MTKEIIITLEFESELDKNEVSEVARDIMSELLSSYCLTGIRYTVGDCNEE